MAQALPLAVGVALSPVRIAAVALMLGTPRGGSNGLAFMLGWIAGIAVSGAVILAISNGADATDQAGPADWVYFLKLGLAALLLLIAVIAWQTRPREGGEAKAPTWTRAVDRVAPSHAAALGVAWSAVNPKNLLLTAGAAIGIAQTGISGGQQAIALGIYILVATVGLGVPILIYFAFPERAAELLGGLRDWLIAHGNALIASVLPLIAAKLIAEAIIGLGA